MKKIPSLLLLLAMVTCLFGQQTINDPNAEKRTAKNFHAISVSHGIDLFLTQGNEEAVAVSAANKEDLAYLKVEVDNGILKIYYDRNQGTGWKNWSNRKLKAYVSAKTLDRLTASGGSDVLIEKTWSGNKLELSISGGSDFTGKINASELNVKASGGSDAHISGSAGKVKLEASGGSDVDGYELVSDYCTVTSTGGSDVRITAHKEIQASASGGSDVHYKGNAVSTSSKSGGSSVKKVN